MSTWVLFQDVEDGITIKVAKKLEFRVIVPDHDMSEENYRRMYYEYLTVVDSAVASMPGLALDSQLGTRDPSQMPTPNTQPFYYRCKKKALGSGSFGKVYLVYDASTGEEYAGKEFHSGQMNYTESDVLACQDHVSNITLSFNPGQIHFHISK